MKWLEFLQPGKLYYFTDKCHGRMEGRLEGVHMYLEYSLSPIGLKFVRPNGDVEVVRISDKLFTDHSPEEFLERVL